MDLEASWSHREGLNIKGGAGLSTVIDVHKKAGPLRVDTLALALKGGPQGLTGTVGVSGGASIGPVTASVADVGAEVALKFARGNLGPVDLGARFKPPTGIGLSVDARGIVTGGGFLFRDEASSLYAGVDAALDPRRHHAQGVRPDRHADARRQPRLLADRLHHRRGLPPDSAAAGIHAAGIGGMVGVNRTFDEDVLRQGLKNGTLATLLFPRDPVGNAPTLIRNLATAFPARRGSYLLGLLAKIGWFTPSLILMDLALILEFGSRTRLLALGRISALLPSADNDLVRLNMEAMGVIDFDDGTAAIDAVLVDSRLAHKFPITGSAALRAGFGGGPSFILSVGGFNPRFAPPANCPALERGRDRAELGQQPAADLRGLLRDHLQHRAVRRARGALRQRRRLQRRRRGRLRRAGAAHAAALHRRLPGPAAVEARLAQPVHGRAEGIARGSAAAAGQRQGDVRDPVVRLQRALRHDAGEGGTPPLPPAVDVLAQLTQALAAPTSWTHRTQRHRRRTAWRCAACRAAGPGAPIVLDPLGQMLVSQQVVPLNTARDIDRLRRRAGGRRAALRA